MATFKRIAEARFIPTGFVTDRLRAQMPHVVRLTDLTRATLGDARFERVYAVCKLSAEQIAPSGFLAETVCENHVRTGYVFAFADKLAATRFALCHEAAMKGRPSPLPHQAVA